MLSLALFLNVPYASRCHSKGQRMRVKYWIAKPNCYFHRCPMWMSQEVMEPFHYINQIPGKGVRGKLIDAFQVIDFTLTAFVGMFASCCLWNQLHHAVFLWSFPWLLLSHPFALKGHSEATFLRREWMPLYGRWILFRFGSRSRRGKYRQQKKSWECCTTQVSCERWILRPLDSVLPWGFYECRV